MKIKENLTKIFDMPADITLGDPRLVMISNKELTIENYKSILEYTSNIIRIKINDSFSIKIDGANLNITTITDDEITINGIIYNIDMNG
ncbi:MAG: YabP/YqfC family sporulation protein [Clostridiales bacterium]|jgi:sporulation protein YqfC|nr:YabP/YqfC family sporulation protein [Clostridiales bacterium]